MSQTVFVTGATGLAGANVCKQLIERGDAVRALARAGADAGPLSALGVEVGRGDITDVTTSAGALREVMPPSTARHSSEAPARTSPISRP